MTLGPAECDVDIAALDIACLAETLAKRGLDGRGLTGRAGADKTDHRGRLLSVNCERPRCRRAADESNEFTPPHCRPQLRTRHRSGSNRDAGRPSAMSALGQKQTCALHQPMSALPPIATAKATFRERSCLLYPQKQTCAVH